MTLGLLDRRLTLLRPVPQPSDGFGGSAAPAYELVATVPAGARADASRGLDELYQADQLTVLERQFFTLRYRADVQATWRVECAGKTYHLTAVTKIGRRQGLLLTAVARGQE